MYTVEQTPEFAKWLKRLKDRKGASIIAARIAGIASGIFGDVKYFETRGSSMGKKALKLTPFDAAEHLQSPQEIRWFLEESIKLAVEEDDGNFEAVRHALETAVRAYGASKLARATGISRDGLYKAFAKGASPKFDTVATVLKTLGVDLFAAYARQAKAKPKPREREHTAA